MKTIEHTETAAIADTAAQERSPRIGHIGRITALSMTTGAVGALVLALVVFSGATEPVIIGVVLLAFATSWAVLAALSARLTGRPQRWARVPAGIMGGLGVASLVFRPTDDTLSTLGWVWPLGLVALAIWMTVQSRRSLPGWSRRVVVYPVIALMVAGGIGGAYETVREAHDRSTYEMPGDLVDVGGHRLHIHCTGNGSPTVVLEDGLGEGSTRMSAWIAPGVAESTRVCVYDRAGRGWSEPGPDDADPLAVVTDLHTLLERHGEQGPFVLAGHSSGGVYVQAFAATYPDEVAGMVLIDSQPAEAFTGLPDYPSFYSGFRKASGIAAPAARFGMMRLIQASEGEGLPADSRAEAQALASTAGHNRSFRDELAALPAVMEQARTLTTLDDKPLVVLTAEKDAQDGWLPLQDEMARLSTNSDHRMLPDSTHASLVQDRAGATTSTDAIVDVVESVRGQAHVPAT
jgi:pimeloyl-ACP methyl ester carboxylesterase